jgi:hypothetical protein
MRRRWVNAIAPATVAVMMVQRLVVVISVAAVCVSALACGGTGKATPLKELQHVRFGDIDVVLLAAGDALEEKDVATLEFRAGGRLVDVGTVSVSATMPMGSGIPPMMGSSFVNTTETPGRYEIETDLSMAGPWRLEVNWDGPRGKGMVTIPGVVH